MQTREQALDSDHAASTTSREAKIPYLMLLKNPQMAVICFSRLVDPMWVTSVHTYLFFQLRYLSPDASDAAIATQAGVIVGARTFARFCTGVLWGMLADSTGRKGVMLIGLSTSCIASIAYGFSTTYSMAMFWQVVQGATNLNGPMARTMVAELPCNADNPKIRASALLLLTLISSAGVLIGPLIGGFTSARGGMGLLSQHPYALPSLIIGAFYGIAVFGVLLVVPETLNYKRLPPTMSLSHASRALRKVVRRGKGQKYEQVPNSEQQDVPLTRDVGERDPAASATPQYAKTTWRQIWTPPVVWTMITHFIITGHIGAFSTMWSIFVSTPVVRTSSESPARPSDGQQTSKPFLFGGGVGLQPPEIGLLMTGATVVGIANQSSALPGLIARMGTVRVWRGALCLFPFAYFLAPFPALVASKYNGSSSSSPHTPAKGGNEITSSGPALACWISLAIIMILFTIARTGAAPSMVILINECVPHPSTRATVNTIGTAVGSMARSAFPMAMMAVYSAGLRGGFVAAGFWLLSLLAFVAVGASRWIGKGLDKC